MSDEAAGLELPSRLRGLREATRRAAELSEQTTSTATDALDEQLTQILTCIASAAEELGRARRQLAIDTAVAALVAEVSPTA